MAAAINPVRGEQHYNSKLNTEDVRLVQALIAEREKHIQAARNLSNAKIAEKFGVHERTIDRISERRGWIHVRGVR